MSASCRAARARLGPYLAGELRDGEHERTRAHLEACEGCAAELDALRRTGDLLRGLPDVEPPPHLAQRVIARVRDGEAEPRRLDGAFGRLGIGDLRGALVAAALAGLVLLLMPERAPDPREQADALRASLREAPTPTPDLALGPRLGAGAAPEPLLPDLDALLAAARLDPTAPLRAWRELAPADRDAFAAALAARARARGEADALADALRAVGSEADALAERLADPASGEDPSREGF